MKILHAVHSWLKPTENWTYRLLKHTPVDETHVLAQAWEPGPFHDPAFRYHSWPVRRVTENGIVGAWWNFAVRHTHGLQEALLAAELRGRVDLLHSHFSFMGWRMRSLARRLGVPHVVSFYGYDYENLPFSEPSWNERYRTMFQEVDHFLCEGAHGVELLANQGCSREKLAISRLGVDTSSIAFAPLRAPSGGRFKFVQVATLTAKKGHVDALKAIAIAARQVDIDYTIVGREADVRQANLTTLAQDLGISDRIHFVNGIDFTRLHEYLGNFDAFLHPSRFSSDRDCEGGAPVVLLDAQAVGLPVISTTHCDIPDEVVHGKTGILSPEADPAALARSIVDMVQMPRERFASMREAARDHVRTEFDLSVCGPALSAMYARIIGSHR